MAFFCGDEKKSLIAIKASKKNEIKKAIIPGIPNRKWSPIQPKKKARETQERFFPFKLLKYLNSGFSRIEANSSPSKMV